MAPANGVEEEMVLEKFKKVFFQKKPLIDNIDHQIEEILLELITEMNEQRPADQQIAKEKKTALFGEGGALDSLELVNLIVAFEQRIQSNLSLAITLADEKAMSQKRNPFGSIESLTDYAVVLVKEKMDG